MNIDIEDLRVLLTRPVAFHKLLAIAGGSVGAGVFLSQLVYWSERTTDPEGWVYKTFEDWWEETALSRFELETIRNGLKKRQLIQEKRAGVPAKLYYRIEWDHLRNALPEAAQKHREGGRKRDRATEYPKGVPPKAPSNAIATKTSVSPQTEGGSTEGKAAVLPKSGVEAAEGKTAVLPQTTLLGQRVLTQTTPESTTTTRPEALEAKERTWVTAAPSSSFSLVGGVSEELSGNLSAQDQLELDAIALEFDSDGRQKAKAEACAKRRGMAFVREQAAIVQLQKTRLRNLAGAFEKACDSPEGWKRPKPVATKKPARRVNADPKPQEPVVQAADFSAELAWWQRATEAQKEAALSHEKLALYRPNVIGKSNPGPIFLSVLRGVLAQKEAAA
jgi:hypothetical protein